MRNEREKNGLTELLYETDGMMTEFDATVIRSDSDPGSGPYAVLDRTAFFPEGGGQQADTGVIETEDNKRIMVTDVKTCDKEVRHFLSEPVENGSKVTGIIDAGQRFSRMQNHGAEHLISGLVHEAFGYDNTGFHMTDREAVFDLGGPLDKEQIRKIEEQANRVVLEDVPVTISFPSPEEAERMEYRSKLDLFENVRLVTIEGVDTCACCAPHLSSTGQFGTIRILEAIPHRKGTRITMIAGMNAYRDYSYLHDSNAKIMEILSAPRDKTAGYVQELMERVTRLREENTALKRKMTQMFTQSVLDHIKNRDPSEGPVEIIFTDSLDPVGLRDLVNECTAVFDGVVCAFLGDDESGYRYIFSASEDKSSGVDIRSLAADFNAGCDGKGGGSALMVQGTSKALKDDAERFIKMWIKSAK